VATRSSLDPSKDEKSFAIVWNWTLDFLVVHPVVQSLNQLHYPSSKYRVFNLKIDHILIWVIYLLRFTTCYITQLTRIYSKCWKWCPFISMHLSTRFTMFLATFLSVLLFTSSMAWVIFIFSCFTSHGLPSKFFKETLSTVGVRHHF
jgi:hypothetical protein